MTKLNYPIKYAPMAIPYVTGRDGLGYRTYDIMGYIPMPCYLVNEIKHYNEDGTTTMYYEIVFAKDSRDLLAENNNQVPQFRWGETASTNSELLKAVYDTYKEAEEKAREKSEIVIGERTAFTPTETYEKRIKEEMDKVESYMDIGFEFDPNGDTIDSKGSPRTFKLK